MVSPPRIYQEEAIEGHKRLATHTTGRWPTDGGTRITSLGNVCALLAHKLKSDVKGAPGAVDPRVLWQDIEAVTAADRLDGGPRLSSALQATCEGKAIGRASVAQGMNWLTDDLSKALRSDIVDWLNMFGNRNPDVWSTGHGSFIPKAKPGEVAAHRPIVPSEPMLGVTSRTFLPEIPEACQPKWVSAEGFTKGSSPDAHILTAELLAEKAPEWCEQTWYLEVELSDAFASIRYMEIWRSLHRSMGAGAARVMMNVIMGHPLAPSRHVMPGEEVPVFKGCKQGAPEIPALCNTLLDDAVAPVLQRWEQMGLGVCAPAFAADHHNSQPNSRGDRAGWITHLGVVDDLVLVAEMRLK